MLRSKMALRSACYKTRHSDSCSPSLLRPPSARNSLPTVFEQCLAGKPRTTSMLRWPDHAQNVQQRRSSLSLRVVYRLGQPLSARKFTSNLIPLNKLFKPSQHLGAILHVWVSHLIEWTDLASLLNVNRQLYKRFWCLSRVRCLPKVHPP
jgi:hypothetical protein